MDSCDWSNGIRYHVFVTRPDTEDLVELSFCALVTDGRSARHFDHGRKRINDPLILVPRKPDAPSAVSSSARRDTQVAYQRRSALGFRVNCGTRYGHGFLEQVIGIVLQ